jgi:hypothetical protein
MIIPLPAEDKETRQPVHSAAEARALVDEFDATMAELIGLIEEETALVRGGRLYAATDLVTRKNELLGLYLKSRARLKAEFSTISRLLPDVVTPLRDRHLAAIEKVRLNLAALAIAREVAEGIVRNVSQTVGRQANPRTYGRNAGVPTPRAAAARGIAVDRRL